MKRPFGFDIEGEGKDRRLIPNATEQAAEPALRVIAHELVTSIKSNVTVDWMHREAARARMRVLVKRLLRKFG